MPDNLLFFFSQKFVYNPKWGPIGYKGKQNFNVRVVAIKTHALTDNLHF